jgi:hypothetical protein
MIKQQILEIRPYPGVLAANVRAIRAGVLAQVIHEGKDGQQVTAQAACQP